MFVCVLRSGDRTYNDTMGNSLGIAIAYFPYTHGRLLDRLAQRRIRCPVGMPTCFVRLFYSWCESMECLLNCCLVIGVGRVYPFSHDNPIDAVKPYDCDDCLTHCYHHSSSYSPVSISTLSSSFHFRMSSRHAWFGSSSNGGSIQAVS